MLNKISINTIIHDEAVQRDIAKFIDIVGYTPDLLNPKTFCEKLMIRKWTLRDPYIGYTADKIKVREMMMEEYLIDAWHTYKPRDIRVTEPCVIKMNNASGRNIFIRDPQKWTDRHIVQLEHWMKLPYGLKNGEWDACYSHIAPGILIETEFLPTPHDVYRIHMIHHEPVFIQVYGSTVNGRLHYQYVSSFDKEWSHLPVQFKGLPNPILPKPEKLQLMLSRAKLLTSRLEYARIDFYIIGDRLLFNEITHFPQSCKIKMEPVEFDHYLGGLL